MSLTVISLGYGSRPGTAGVITLGYGTGAAPPPPVIVTNQGGGTSSKLRKRKQTIIRFSDFAARDEYERKLKEAVTKSGIALKSPAQVIAEVEQLASQSISIQKNDTEIRLSAENLAKLQNIKNDEEAMLLLLMAII